MKESANINGGAKLKILLVDDSKVVMQVYKEALSDALYEKRYAMNGEEALTVYKAWQPDIILLDIVLPVMTGYSALKEIRRLEKESGSRTAIIMVTSLGDSSDVKDCARLGIQGYIVKPFRAPDLAQKIEQYYAAYANEKTK